jgi:hypothetical protein
MLLTFGGTDGIKDFIPEEMQLYCVIFVHLFFLPPSNTVYEAVAFN